jgi:hypothetical protein
VSRTRIAALLAVVVAALFLTGCGPKSERERDAIQAVKDTLPAADYDIGETRCTSNPAPWFVQHDTDVFVCAAKRHDGNCDWYQATLRNAGWEVVLAERQAGCVLPF